MLVQNKHCSTLPIKLSDTDVSERSIHKLANG